jgi:hypothetical protein
MAGRPAPKKGANKAASPAQTNNNKRKSNPSKEPSSKKAKVAPAATKVAAKGGKKSAKAAVPQDDSEDDDESWAYGAVSGSDDSDVEEMVGCTPFDQDQHTHVLASYIHTRLVISLTIMIFFSRTYDSGR